MWPIISQMSNRCEAKITYEVTRKPIERYIYDLDGRRFDRGSNIIDKPGEAEVTLICDKCRFSDKFKAEGMGPAGAVNVGYELARKFLKENCPKMAQLKDKRASTFDYLSLMPQELS